MSKYVIDLNCDMGEGFGMYRLGPDEEIMSYISSANVACAYHAGDPHIMFQTLKSAKENNVAVGAHVGLPDLEGFGRRKMAVSAEQARNYIIYQVGALLGFAQHAGLKLQHVKPHGALYVMAGEDRELSEVIVETIAGIDPELIIFTQEAFVTYDVAVKKGVPVVKEFYGDRGTKEDGTLVFKFNYDEVGGSPQGMADRIVRVIKENKVTAVNGKEVSVVPDSVCIHSDTPMALDFFQAVKDAFAKENIEIKPVGKK